MSKALDRIRSTGSPWLFEFGLQLAEVTAGSKFGLEAWDRLPDELVERLWAATVELCTAKEGMRLHTHGETALAEALRRVAQESPSPTKRPGAIVMGGDTEP
ncbi:MAG: hypothetical protein ACOX1P_16460 [Thermoguttaceae bacterium]|jgi:hypothetical protein